MTLGRTPFSFLVAVLALGCTDLPDVVAGCGNGVVDPGESCDTNDPACRQPGDELACRHDCSLSPESGERRACPAGWGCGLDDVCRAPSGSFDLRPSAISGLTLRLSGGDLDGDRATDIVSSRFSGVSAHYFDRDAAPVQTHPVAPTRFASVAIGPLAGAGQPHAVVLPSPQGVSVLVGQKDRTLPTKSYASFPVLADDLHFIVFEGLPKHAQTGAYDGAELLAFATFGGTTWLADVFGDKPLFAIDAELEEIRRGALGANFDLTRPCDDLAVARPRATQIVLYTMCQPEGEGWTWKTTDNLRKLKLPPGFELGSGYFADAPQQLALAGDVDGDGYMDLMVQAVSTGLFEPAVLVAYGLGDGTFRADPDDGTLFSVYDAPPVIAGQLPLAIGKITDDGALDGVTSTAIYWSSPDGSCGPNGYACQLLYGSAFSRATKALIQDLNRDGIADVVTLDDMGMSVGYYSGTGAGFVRHAISGSGPISDFAHADFDGDQLGDIALQEQSFTGSHLVSIAFGRPFGAPEPATVVAKFPEVVQIAAGPFSLGQPDLLDDLTILTRSASGDLGAALLSGSTDRRLQSPFSMFVGELAAFVRAAVIGEFDDDDERHADLAVLSAGLGFGPSSALVDNETRLWLIPSSGEAELDGGDAAFSEPLAKSLAWCGAILVPIDLGGDRSQELVMLTSRADPFGAPIGGSIVVARPERGSDGKRRFVTDAPIEVEETFGDSLAALECQMDAPPGRTVALPFASPTAVGDVDADGDDDLVTVGYIFDSNFVALPRVIVHRNNGSGTLDPAARSVLEVPIAPHMIIFGIALVQADGDPALELLIATSPPEPEHESGGGVFLLDFDPVSGQIESFVELASGPTFAILAGDFDGNGVSDFAAGGMDGVLMGIGRAVLP
jgi:hypothetical protein